MHRTWLLLGAFSLLLPLSAFAHGTLPGAGAVINGLVHPFYVPGHLLLSLALGLHIGQQGKSQAVRLLAAYGAVLMLGAWLSDGLGAAVQSMAEGMSIELLALLWALPVSIVVAARLQLSAALSGVLLLPAALFLGADSVPENLSGFNFALALAANLFILTYLLLWLAAAVWRLQQTWQQIAFRIAASWLAAISVLLSAFLLSR